MKREALALTCVLGTEVMRGMICPISQIQEPHFSQDITVNNALYVVHVCLCYPPGGTPICTLYGYVPL